MKHARLWIPAATLAIAIDWKTYVQSFGGDSRGGKAPVYSPPKSNHWGFTADRDRIIGILTTHFSLDPFYADRCHLPDSARFRPKVWITMRKFLAANEKLLGNELIDVTDVAIASITSMPEEMDCIRFVPYSENPEEARHIFNNFLLSLAANEIAVSDLMAAPKRQHAQLSAT